MKLGSLILGLSLISWNLTACRSDKDDAVVSEPVLGGADATAHSPSIATDPVAEGSSPLLNTCYKGDTWTCAVEAAVVRETNLLRSKPLIQSFESSYVARGWSEAQAQTGQLSHDGFPEKRQEALEEAFPKNSWPFFAENVAMTQASDPDANKIAKQFVTMWKGSPGHMKNIQGRYQYLGVGIVRLGNSFYATQLFH